MAQDWNNQNIVDQYTAAAHDSAKNWYEVKVNEPAILGLLPEAPARVLDFGCGPGNFTATLGQKYEVVGVDASEVMIQKAQQNYPDTTFLTWDGLSALSSDYGQFDAVVTKLTLEFIEDLQTVARHLRDALAVGGLLVTSMQHPLLAINMHPEKDIPYWGMSRFEVEVGTTGATVTKIHRNFGEYVAPFVRSGFLVEKIDEPQIPQEVAGNRPLRPEDLKFPKRLNIQFRAA